MNSPPFIVPEAAYQLHYYLCFRTYRNRPLLTDSIQSSLNEHLLTICDRCQFHLLESRLQETHFQLLVSLGPEHSVAHAIKMIKGNVSRLLSQQNSQLGAGAIWSRGYFAKRSGTVAVDKVSTYIASQAEHHGYLVSAAMLCWRSCKNVGFWTALRGLPVLAMRVTILCTA